MHMFLSIERKMSCNSKVKEKYSDFTKEYIHLYHMELTFSFASSGKESFNFPRHAVFGDHNPNGKIRVVFNGFILSGSGFSLNDEFLPGPKLQCELWIVFEAL